MTERTYSLIHEADAMMHRFCARYAGAPLSICKLVKTVYLLGGLDDAQLARYRQPLRLIHKFIGRALACADDQVERNRLAKRAAPENPPPQAGEGNRPQDGGGGA